jgi:predicted PurR-regulated permease PerM
MLTCLFVLACFYTLYFARDFILPVVLALFMSFLLWPLVRWLARVRVPEPAGAAIVLVTVFSALAFAGYELSAPASEWFNRAPELAQKVQQRIRALRAPVEKVTQATEKITTPPVTARRSTVVQVEKPSLFEQLFLRTWDLTLGAALVLILLYFLLASGDLFLRKLIRVLPRFEDKKRAVQIAREIETSISRYLVTQALINAGLGTAAGIVFWLLGLPDPAVWGVLGAILNFVPFIGAATTIGIVFVVASASFPTLRQSLLPPLAYLVLGVLEGSVIAPYTQGRRLLLNPVVLIIGLTFWGWLWGIAGALLAVPMMVTFKIFCDHIEPFAPIAEFLGRE